uniref:CST complex subunit TEN1 isoform X2 n=1 Tax=Myxine glutinosa TaxID=7769 RepID=UPI00358FB541
MAIGLPAAAVWHFLWELSDTFTISTAEAGENSDQAASVQSVRTYGRLASYNAQTSRAILYISRHGTTHSLKVNTSLVEPFAAHNGSFYLFLGELEKLEGMEMLLCARLVQNIDGVQLALLETAILSQRTYFQSRKLQQKQRI